MNNNKRSLVFLIATLLISPIYSMKKEKTEEEKKQEERFIRMIRPEKKEEETEFDSIILETKDGNKVEVTNYQANQLVPDMIEEADPEDDPEISLRIPQVTKKDLEDLLKLIGKDKGSGYGTILYLMRDDASIDAKLIEGLSKLLNDLKIGSHANLIRLFKAANYLNAKKITKVLLLALAYMPITKALIAQLPIDEIIEIAMVRFALFPYFAKGDWTIALSLAFSKNELKNRLTDDALKKYLDIKDNFDIIIPIFFNEEGKIADLEKYNLTESDLARLKKMGLDTKRLEKRLFMIKLKRKDPFKGKRIIYVDEEKKEGIGVDEE
ncbi:hypothetical protein ACFLYA_02820 [Candidatus Dependentiae bacterium]